MGRHRRVHVVEQPLVGTEGSVEPHAVVQARTHEVVVVPADVVRGQDRVDEGHVGRVGGHARVQQRVVGQLAVRPDPHSLAGLARAAGVPREVADVALVDRVGPVEPLGQLLLPGLEALGEGRQRLGFGHVGHGELVLQALLEIVERGLEVEDGPAVLNGHDPPGGEGPPVADAVHFVEDGNAGVAWPQEVRVQRMHAPVLDRATRRHQRLSRHLPAEHALTLLVGLGTPEDVDLNGFEIKQIDEELQGRAHPPMFAARRIVRRRAHHHDHNYPAAA